MYENERNRGGIRWSDAIRREDEVENDHCKSAAADNAGSDEKYAFVMALCVSAVVAIARADDAAGTMISRQRKAARTVMIASS